VTIEELQELKAVIGGMRFMQASSLVTAGLNDNLRKNVITGFTSLLCGV